MRREPPTVMQTELEVGQGAEHAALDERPRPVQGPHSDPGSLAVGCRHLAETRADQATGDIHQVAGDEGRPTRRRRVHDVPSSSVFLV